MSTRSSRNAPKEPLSPQAIQARILIAVFSIALIVALILPWVFTK